MTTKSAFSPEEWTTVTEGPPTAGMIVITTAHGGMFRETISMAKAYAEARDEHGDSELLDEIVASKPKLEHTRYRSPDELKEHGLAQLRDAVALVGTRRPPRNWMTTGVSWSPWPTSSRPHTGSTGRVSPAEEQAIQEITTALGAPAGDLHFTPTGALAGSPAGASLASHH